MKDQPHSGPDWTDDELDRALGELHPHGHQDPESLARKLAQSREEILQLSGVAAPNEMLRRRSRLLPMVAAAAAVIAVSVATIAILSSRNVNPTGQNPPVVPEGSVAETQVTNTVVQTTHFVTVPVHPGFDTSGAAGTVTAPTTTSSLSSDGPESTPTSAANVLSGKSFRLVKTFTDAGGADRSDKDVKMIMSFTDNSATVQIFKDGSECGNLTYENIVVGPEDEFEGLQLGEPTGTSCPIGEDPVDPPALDLFYSLKGETLSLSTGFVGWTLKQQ